MKGGELRALLPLVVVLLMPQTADAAFTARTTATATFRAAESFGARNVVPPSIVGEAFVGEPLTATPGAWDPADARVTITWELEIAGEFQPVATGNAFTPTLIAGWKWLRVVASAGATSVASAPVLVDVPELPKNVTLPEVVGTMSLGATITATEGAWENRPTSLTGEWQRCAGRTDVCAMFLPAPASHTVTTSDIGYALRRRITASNAIGATDAFSAATAPLAPSMRTPSVLREPAFTGTQLRGTFATWWQNSSLSGSSRVSWWRCPGPEDLECVQRGTLSGSSYLTVAGDFGYYIRRRESLAQNGVEGTTTSNAVGPIEMLPPRLAATVTTSVAGAPGVSAAADGSTTTVWSTLAAQRSGDWVRLDFGSVRSLAAYELTARRFAGFVCEVSADGLSWEPIAGDPETTTSGPGTALSPRPQARFLRLRLTADGADGWSLNDIRVWGS